MQWWNKISRRVSEEGDETGDGIGGPEEIEMGELGSVGT